MVKNIILSLSILLNVILLGVLGYSFSQIFIKTLDGCAEIADGKIGVLNKDLTIGYFNEGNKLFTLPKGLVVRDASATGMGWFEPHRFRLVITSDDAKLVDYTIDSEQLPNDSEYYSADIDNN